ncbi:MAG: c-type cytochrome [Flavobacteriaceae bacterium]
MNRFLFVLLIFFVISCGKKEPEAKSSPSKVEKSEEQANLDLGKKIFNGKGQCLTCHKTSQKVIGPSVSEIVSIYKQENADMVAFLKGNLDPIVDPSQFMIMKINIDITKKMTDEELRAVVDYMYHLAEK